MKTEAELRQTLAELEELDRAKTYGGQILFFAPYPKQRLFFELGKTKTERVLFAGNRNGKSTAGAYELACHLTGWYPNDWPGWVWKRPVRWWAAGETAESVLNVVQRKLCGDPGIESSWGTGMIPRANLISKSMARGVSNLIDTVQVRHASGGISTLTFKSYGEGRENYQGEGLDGIWFDEEPPPDIYSEGLTRLLGTNGRLFMTYTAIKGKTLLTERLMEEKLPSRGVVYMAWDEAKHLSEDEKKIMWASWQPHERETRAYGKPMQGEGAIFRTPEDAILEDVINPVPVHWLKIWGIDPGIGHPFGAVLLLHDLDNDCVHVHHTIRMADVTPVMHAAAMRPIGADVPVAYPKDAVNRDPGSGGALIELYRRENLRCLSSHATWPDGSLSTWAGITDWDQREQTNRFKVNRQCKDFLTERRDYHIKRSKAGVPEIVKIRDDLLSACRVGLMMLRYAKAVPLGSKRNNPLAGDPSRRYAKGSMNHPEGSFDLFGV